MPLIKELISLGGSRAVVLPKPFLDQLSLDDPNAQVELSLTDGQIVIVPHRYAAADEFKASTKRMLSKHQKSLRRLAR